MPPRKNRQTQASKPLQEIQNPESLKPVDKYTIEDLNNRWRKFVGSDMYSSSRYITNTDFMTSGQFFVNDPYLLNQRIKSLKSRPNFLERDDIEQALTKPEQNETALREATHSMIYNTYPLYRLNMLYEGILKYRDYVEPLYVDKNELNKPRFKSDWKFIDMWVKKLDAKKQFRRIVGEVIPEGKRAYYLRQGYSQETGKERVDYVHFQDLPSDWYKIIKHSTDSYEVIAFNFAYFWQAGTTLGQFPPIFAKYYEELMSATEVNNGVRSINLAKTPEDVVVEYNDKELTWYYWKELPQDECFVFSFTETDDLQISPFSSLLLNAQDLASYQLLQQQLLSMPLYQMILGELPMHDDNKSGGHLDDLRLSPEMVSMFEAKVNAGMPPGTIYSMVPSLKNSIFRFQEVPNANEIYNKGLQQMINTTGVSTLLTTTDRPNVAQVSAGKVLETRYIDRMYDQWEWAINIILENMYDNGVLKYRWHYRIHGDAFSEKDEIAAVEKSLSLGQIELLPKYLSYHGHSLLDAVNTADWVESSGLYKKFKPLINTFGMSGNPSKSTAEDKKTGRPALKEDEIENENTANSVGTGQNTAEMRE